jgi:hypothetical protein
MVVLLLDERGDLLRLGRDQADRVPRPGEKGAQGDGGDDERYQRVCQDEPQ